MSVPEKLFIVFRDAMGPQLTPEEVTLGATLDELGVDNIHRMEIAMGIEDEFDIVIEDEIADEWTSVAEIVALWQSLEEGR